MSMCRVSSCVVGRGYLLWPMRSPGKTVSLCPAWFCTPRPNLPVTPGIYWLPTFAFQSPMMKRWRRQWHPTPVLLPGKSHGRRSLAGCSPWGLEESDTTEQLPFTFTFHFHALEKDMVTHSSVLAWRIPGTAEPGGLPSMGSHRVGHDWSDLAAAWWWAHLFLMLVLEGLIDLHRTIQLQLLQHNGWGKDLDYHDVKWFASEVSWDRCVIFEIAPNYRVSDSFVNYHFCRLEEGMANQPSILASRAPWRVWKGKKIWHQKMSPLGQKVSRMQLGNSKEIAPEKMKRLGQSKNNAQLWMCLVLKEKSDTIKNNIAQEPGMIGPQIKVNWKWSSRNEKTEHQYLRN